MSEDNQERLYQFGVHAMGGMVQVGDKLVFAHTLQLFMDRDGAHDLLVNLANQLKSSDSQIVAELEGWMILADEIQQGFRDPDYGKRENEG